MRDDRYFVHDSKKFKIWINQDGYACVTWGRGRDRRPFLLHRLVYLLAFGPIPEGHQIHHLDGDRSNWSPENLQAVTPQAHRAMHYRGRYALDDESDGELLRGGPSRSLTLCAHTMRV